MTDECEANLSRSVANAFLLGIQNYEWVLATLFKGAQSLVTPHQKNRGKNNPHRRREYEEPMRSRKVCSVAAAGRLATGEKMGLVT